MSNSLSSRSLSLQGTFADVIEAKRQLERSKQFRKFAYKSPKSIHSGILSPQTEGSSPEKQTTPRCQAGVILSLSLPPMVLHHKWEALFSGVLHRKFKRGGTLSQRKVVRPLTRLTNMWDDTIQNLVNLLRKNNLNKIPVYESIWLVFFLKSLCHFKANDNYLYGQTQDIIDLLIGSTMQLQGNDRLLLNFEFLGLQMEQVLDGPLSEALWPYMGVPELLQMRTAAQAWNDSTRYEPADGEAFVGSPFGLCDCIRVVESRGTKLEGGNEGTLVNGY